MGTEKNRLCLPRFARLPGGLQPRVLCAHFACFFYLMRQLKTRETPVNSLYRTEVLELVGIMESVTSGWTATREHSTVILADTQTRTFNNYPVVHHVFKLALLPGTTFHHINSSLHSSASTTVPVRRARQL